MSVLVAKIGGTSLGSPVLNDVLDHMVARHRDDAQLQQIIVVSAASLPGQKKGGTTDQILAMLRGRPAPSEACGTDVAGIYQIAAQQLSLSGVDQQHLDQDIRSRLARIKPGAPDDQAAVGESFSVKLLECYFKARHIECDTIDFSGDTGLTLPQPDDFKEGIADAKQWLGEALQGKKAPIIVLGGAFKFPGGLFKQVGRSYTDLCAALAASWYNDHHESVQCYEMWKEVALSVCDPSWLKPGEGHIGSITWNCLEELGFLGMQALHDQVAGLLSQRVDVVFRNVNDVGGARTTILADDDPRVSEMKPFTAMQITERLVVLRITLRDPRARGQTLEVADILSHCGLSYELGFTSTRSWAVTLPPHLNADFDEHSFARSLDQASALLHAKGHHLVRDDQMSVISLVGPRFNEKTGLAADFLRVMAEQDVNVLFLSGGSGYSVSLGCPQHSLKKAVAALLDTFFS